MIGSFRDLEVYKLAYRLALEVHKITLSFPEIERYELGSQMRRASKSVTMNVAEGFGRNDSIADFKRFMVMAIGSNDEVRSQLDYCIGLGYIDKGQYEKLDAGCVSVGKMLTKMKQNWKIAK